MRGSSANRPGEAGQAAALEAQQAAALDAGEGQAARLIRLRGIV